MLRFLAHQFAVVMIAVAVLVSSDPSAHAGTGWQDLGAATAAACTACAEPAASETCIPVSCPAAVFSALAAMVPQRDDSTPALAHQRKGRGIKINLDPPPPKPS
ncbi:hypothetical protein HBA54_25445 [Pelagibius litoralis]|uniref:Uncharacterized protein n=1 Tax=Pelagibius litoralis TaxID=374515 RepID=A0A967F2I0_9PROT|nr:hypothetical protein [Pelagibius litoralis]NIA71949.1 hypothetical protein [Pelagibius litoralis]